MLKSLNSFWVSLLTAGAEAPIVAALEKLLAMRAFFRARQLGGGYNLAVLEEAGMSREEAEEMHRYLAIADYEDRFVIPTSHREQADDAYELRGNCGFSFGNGCDAGDPHSSLFGGKMGRRKLTPIRMLDR